MGMECMDYNSYAFPHRLDIPITYYTAKVMCHVMYDAEGQY